MLGNHDDDDGVDDDDDAVEDDDEDDETEDGSHLSRFAKLGLSSTSFLLNAHTQRIFPMEYVYH